MMKVKSGDNGKTISVIVKFTMETMNDSNNGNCNGNDALNSDR